MEILQIELVVLGLVCFFVLKSFVCRKISVTYISEIKVKSPQTELNPYLLNSVNGHIN